MIIRIPRANSAHLKTSNGQKCKTGSESGKVRDIAINEFNESNGIPQT